MSIIGRIQRYMGAVRTPDAPGIFKTYGGPTAHALMTAGAGAGLGWLYGRFAHPLINSDVDPVVSGRAGALIGGGLGFAPHIPTLVDQYRTHGLWGNDGRSGINSTIDSRLAGAIEAGERAREQGEDYTKAHDLYLNGKDASYLDPPDDDVSIGHAREDIAFDRYLSPSARHMLMSGFPEGSGATTGRDVARRIYANNPSSYWPKAPTETRITFDQYTPPAPQRGGIGKGIVGAGVGYAGAGLLGTTLGAIFGMSRTTQRKLRNVGAIAGALYNTGMLR